MSLNNTTTCLVQGRSTPTLGLRTLCLFRLPLIGLLLLAAISQVTASEVLASDRAKSARQTHSLWTTPGELVSFRIPARPAFDSSNHDLGNLDNFDTQETPIVVTRSKPDTAQLLDNPDGSRTFFWMPQARDIGSRKVDFFFFDHTGSTEQLQMTLQLYVLEARFGGDRLNSLPDLVVTAKAGGREDEAISDNGLLETVEGESVSLQLLATDTAIRQPDLHVIDLPHHATLELTSEPGQNHEYDRPNRRPNGRSSGSESRANILWDTRATSNGYTNFTVYAVDQEYPLQFVSHTVNVLVEKVLATTAVRLSKADPLRESLQTQAPNAPLSLQTQQNGIDQTKTLTITLSSFDVDN